MERLKFVSNVSHKKASFCNISFQGHWLGVLQLTYSF